MNLVTFSCSDAYIYVEAITASDTQKSKGERKRTMSVQGLIVASGDEGRELNEKQRSSHKVTFLKKNKTFRGRFISTKFVTFAQHGSMEQRVKSHACLDPRAKREGRESTCPSCVAGWSTRLKTLVFWWNIDAQEIVVRDVTKGNMKAVYAAVDQYGDDLTTDTFQVSMGEKGDLSFLYLKPKRGEEFAATPETVEITDDVLAYVMGVRTAAEISEMIAGKSPKSADEGSGDDVEIKDVETGDDPTKAFD